MTQVMQTVHAPAGPFVVPKTLIVARDGDQVSEHVKHPEKEDPEPCGPQRVALPQMGLKLSKNKRLPILQILIRSTVYHQFY